MDSLIYNTPNILIVDDVESNLYLLTEMVRNAGYIARPVTNVKQAIAAIKSLPPHLILLDVSMPEIDGFEFCTMLKNSASTRDIPVIFISARNSTENKINGFKLGAVDYIEKPFEVEEVTLRINTHLKIYKMQQEFEVYNKKLYKIINDQMHKIYEEQKNILYALAKLTAKRDNFKPNHLECVGKNSKLLALSLQLTANYSDDISNSFIDTIELAAPLHDIGNVAISDGILLKRGKLTPSEMEIVRSHSDIGANTLQEIYTNSENNEFICMAIDIARYHHENWDGSGFPKGLAGEEIPLCARIVSLIDVYDILHSERSYRPAYPHEECLEIINQESGKKFDPNLVEIFNKICNQLRK